VRTTSGRRVGGRAARALVRRLRPGTGEGMCVTTCLAAPICDVEAVSCGAFIPKVAPVECIDGGCFPAVCDVLADCPAGSVECDAGLCY